MPTNQDIAGEVLKDVTVNTKSMTGHPHGEVLKWVDVLSLGQDSLKIPASNSDGFKFISLQEARFVGKHFGIKFILNHEEKESQNGSSNSDTTGIRISNDSGDD